MELSAMTTPPSLAPSRKNACVEIRDLYFDWSNTTDDKRPQSRTEVFYDAPTLGQLLKDESWKGYLTRIILVSKPYSWAPFNVQEDILREIIQHHNVSPEFLHMVHSFRRKTNRIEEAYTDSVWIQYQGPDLIEILYALKYPEIQKRKTINDKPEWSIRQTGIYQAYNSAAKQSTRIIILPNQESGIRNDVLRNEKPSDTEGTALSNPLAMHIYLLQSRMTNWKLYISHFEEEVWEMANLAHSVNIGASLPFQESYDDLSNLHYIESRLAPLPPIFDAQRDLIEKLNLVNSRLVSRGQVAKAEADAMCECLQNIRSRIDAYDRNVQFVLRKIRSTTQLVSDTISLKSQHNVENLSNHMLVLNKSTVKDSTSVRVITLVTLVYLPSSFVSAFFGMVFFSTSGSSGGHLVLSPYLWLFFALSVTLTVMTLVYWRWSVGQAVRARAMQDAENLC